MLEHQKTVLKGVGHDKRLFKKELIKSMAWLNENDKGELQRWVCQNYLSMHPDIIQEVIYPCLDQAS